MQGFNITELMQEIESLSSIAEFGSLRLKELSKQNDTLKAELNDTEQHASLTSCINNIKKFQNSIHASEQAILNWREKVDGYFYQVHEYAKQVGGEERSQLLVLSETMTELMKTFSSQLALVTQVSEKSKQLILSAERKQKSMTASFERGRAPILVRKRARMRIT